MASGDEFLDLLLTQAERTNELLGHLLDRLPAPAAAGAGPGRIDIREPLPEGATVSGPPDEPVPAATDPEPAGKPPAPRKAAPRKTTGRAATKTSTKEA
jgi:hypothetical protein